MLLFLQLFVGQKYGHPHVPVEILYTDMEKIKAALKATETDMAPLDRWYTEDKHVIPHVYRLKHDKDGEALTELYKEVVTLLQKGSSFAEGVTCSPGAVSGKSYLIPTLIRMC